MKAFEKSQYKELEVAEQFNSIILNNLDSYEGKKKEQLKSYLENLQRGGCQSGFVSEFIYNEDCKTFYIEHLDELEDMKQDLEDNIGEPIKNRQSLPHYTFMCWLCFEGYCYDLYSVLFDN